MDLDQLALKKPADQWRSYLISADPDQLLSEEASWSGTALFVIKYVNLYQQPGSSNLIGWQLEVGMPS